MRRVGRLTAGLAVATMLSACSSGGTSPGLPSYGGGSSAASSAPPTSPTASPTASSNRSPSGSSTATGAPTTVTVARGHVPALTAEQQPVAEAWFAYWDYLTAALTDPASREATSGVGKVATGSPANDMIRQISGLAAKKHHVVGTTTVNISSVSAIGGQGTVCSRLGDLSYEVSSSGAVVESPQLRTPTFKAVLTKDGPIWRLSSVTRVPSC